MTTLAEKRQVLADAKKFAAQFAGFMKAAEIIDELANVDQVTDEKRRNVKKLQDQIENLQKQADDIIAAANGTAKAAVDIANEKAAAIKASAEGEARGRASTIVAEAERMADDIKAAAEGEKDRLERAIAKMAAQVVDLQGQHEHHVALINASKEELLDVNTALNRARDEYSRFKEAVGL